MAAPALLLRRSVDGACGISALGRDWRALLALRIAIVFAVRLSTLLRDDRLAKAALA